MPWGGGNGGSWGPSPWGDGASVPPSPPSFALASIDSIEVVGAAIVKVNFNVPMKIDGFLLDPSNYTITLQDAGSPVSINRVWVPTGSSTSYVFLNTTKYSVGSTYTVAIDNLRTSRGNSVDPSNNSASFYGRVTKFDLAQNLYPSSYSRDIDSVLTNVLIAITSEDEKIGGTGDE